MDNFFLPFNHLVFGISHYLMRFEEVRGAAGADASEFGDTESAGSLNHFDHRQHRHIFSSSAAGEGDGGCDEDEYEVPFEYSPHPLVVGDHLYTHVSSSFIHAHMYICIYVYVFKDK